MCSNTINIEKCGLSIGSNYPNYISLNGINYTFTTYSKNGKSACYIGIDINGPKGPNRINKDFWAFMLTQEGKLVPCGYTEGLKREQVFTQYVNYFGDTIKYHSTLSADQGTTLLYLDNFKIKKDFPW